MAGSKMTGNGRSPLLTVPPHSCEAHSHIYGPESEYPFWPGRPKDPPASVVAYNQMLNRLGFERAVIVQPAAYGTDNRCTIDAIAARGLQTTRGVCVTKKDVSAEELQSLHDQGMRGLRFFLMADDFVLTDALSMAKKIEPFGWHIQFQDEGDWLEAAVPVFEELPVDSVVDHIGRTGAGSTVDNRGFQILLKFMETGRCWVKISAPYYMTSDGYKPLDGSAPDYAMLKDHVQALVDVRPDRLVWGANWPHPQFPLNDKPEEADCLDALLEWVPDGTIRNKILVDNPNLLYGF